VGKKLSTIKWLGGLHGLSGHMTANDQLGSTDMHAP